MKLISCTTIEAAEGDTVEAIYRIGPSPASGDALPRCEVKLSTSLAGADASLALLSSGQQAGEDQAFDALATALEGAAAALRARGEAKMALPLYS
jgi:hypothetical protein